MYFLKSDINQFEHLITLLIFVGIFMVLSGNEGQISIFQKYIDNYLGFCSLDKNNDNHNISNITSLSLPFYNQTEIVHILEVIKEWIIKDYKSSQCRKWIKWINNKRLIIFSS